MQLRNRRVLVTGGAVRVGRAICLAFSRAGAEVLIHYHRHSDEAEELAESIRTGGGWADTVAGPLDSEAACGAIMDKALAMGPLHGLVNNAAVFQSGRLCDCDGPALLAQMQPNLFAPLFLMRGLAAHCRAGFVVNLLDRRVAAHDADYLAYSLSKQGLAELTRLAALDLAPHIRVNAVAPGPVLPPPGETRPDYLRQHGGRLPLEHPPSPEAVAQAVLFLACAPSTTGQILFVDGGQHLLGNGA